jgi:two-component system, probable response regulator PhcQ
MYRILLVDDEQNVLNALRRELEEEYEIETFSNPAEALKRCNESRFDLVVADYQMPEMNGIQFLKQFSKLQPDAARLILSGQADTSVLVNAINETHIYRFIDKPWGQTELAGTIAQALAYRKVLLENRRLSESSLTKQHPAHKVQEPDRRYQILVVDDEPNILNAVARDLTSRSTFQDLHMALLREADPEFPGNHMDFRFEVYTTTSPLQALDYATRVVCDVVIADYLMPEMNGLDFLGAFREKQPDAARILISGHTNKHTLTEAINHLEIFSFISKPWREYELKSAVTQGIIFKNLLLENRLLAREIV